MPLAVASLTATALTADRADGGAVHRVRTVLVDPVSGALTVDEHVRVRCSAPTGWAILGDVLIAPGAGARWAARLAYSCPGALVVAVHSGGRCWLRAAAGGAAAAAVEPVAVSVAVFEVRGPGRARETWDRLASLAHSCLVAGVPGTELGAAVAALEPAVGSLSPGRVGSGTRSAYRPEASPSSRSSRSSRSRSASAPAEPDRPAEA
ncbi:hypothetical protein KVH02_15145 [Streptomyces olivaceus]|uniref:AraC family transcriptional regulator n=1 Tax=Streptomyces olivaceus TaxID=47716 RepID=A0ABS7W2T3_STROV|nr:hypothetical protein [Streptomyces olivaceus]MBZ6089660.1 hypothetical protein [Streptomyces olivaceus]MBZ6098569.1 hypothetical protein [Streptomyces olivaceus]MBZ6152294.1 hypothetical protein [Streptomyces olivaceus]MBZ6301264.1 hypothetical protein [Streptomyces olivaceus]MBZ6304885.1 hypothetical protein [Streptomyces olivaceus]